MIDGSYLRFARAALFWMANTSFISWREYNHLIRDVKWHEMRVNGCEGLKKFHLFEVAEKVAKRMRRNRNAVVQPYHCRVCSFVHIADFYHEERPRALQHRMRVAREKAHA